MSSNIKMEFGRRFREARDSKKMSRAALGLRLGISPKTIQSWEMGRTFIEDLSLIPSIESELGISISGLFAQATESTEDIAAEAPAAYGSNGLKSRSRMCAGPLPVNFDVVVDKVGKGPSDAKLAESVVAVPMLKPSSANKPVSELTARDVIDYVVIPGEWVPRGGVLVAYRMGDSGMSPMIPLDGTVIVDRREVEPVKVFNKVLAFHIKGKGLRIRRLIKEHASGKMYGMTALEGQRGKLPFRPDREDAILGRVVGVLAKPE